MELGSSHRHPYIYLISLQQPLLLTFCFGHKAKYKCLNYDIKGARVRFDRVEFALRYANLRGWTSDYIISREGCNIKDCSFHHNCSIHKYCPSIHHKPPLSKILLTFSYDFFNTVMATSAPRTGSTKRTTIHESTKQAFW